jgi:hypothetical protein
VVAFELIREHRERRQRAQVVDVTSGARLPHRGGLARGDAAQNVSPRKEVGGVLRSGDTRTTGIRVTRWRPEMLCVGPVSPQPRRHLAASHRVPVSDIGSHCAVDRYLSEAAI